jgi:hypothetical protein
MPKKLKLEHGKFLSMDTKENMFCVYQDGTEDYVLNPDVAIRLLVQQINKLEDRLSLLEKKPKGKIKS